MAMSKIGLVAAALALGACASSGSGSAGAGTTTAATRPENPGGEGEHHHHQGGYHHTMPPAMVAFHDVIAPLWHSEPSAERDGRTCEQAATLRARAGAVAEMPVPESAQSREQGWRTTTAQLVATSDALVATCGATPRGEVAGGLAAVHTAFHGLLDHMGQGHH